MSPLAPRLAAENEGRSEELSGQDRMAEEEPMPLETPERSGARIDEATPLVAKGAAMRVNAAHHRHDALQAFQSLLYVMVIALFVITFVVQPFRIPSESMVPTLLVGDFLLVDKQAGIESPPTALVPSSPVRRGDMIVFRYPIDPSMHLVKRVVGMPGDHVHLRDGHAYVDGRALYEPYTIFQPAAPDGYRDDFPRMVSANPGVDSRWWIQMHTLVANGELTVPPDSYFVLGDNRNDSEDSRYWGLVPKAAIVGKPVLIYFSLNNPGPTPGQPSAVAMQGGGASNTASHSKLAGFARWGRAFRIVR